MTLGSSYELVAYALLALPVALWYAACLLLEHEPFWRTLRATAVVLAVLTLINAGCDEIERRTGTVDACDSYPSIFGC